jgi:hypothetical protein
MIGSNGGSIGGTDDWYSPELLEVLKSGENETRRDGTVKSDVFSQGPRTRLWLLHFTRTKQPYPEGNLKQYILD